LTYISQRIALRNNIAYLEVIFGFTLSFLKHLSVLFQSSFPFSFVTIVRYALSENRKVSFSKNFPNNIEGI